MGAPLKGVDIKRKNPGGKAAARATGDAAPPKDPQSKTFHAMSKSIIQKISARETKPESEPPASADKIVRSRSNVKTN